MTTPLSTHARVRDVLRELQERERQGPPCPRCGLPIVRIRLAVGPVVRRGRRYVAERHQSAAELGACQCPPIPNTFDAGLCHRCGEPRNQPERHQPDCPWHPAWLHGGAA